MRDSTLRDVALGVIRGNELKRLLYVTTYDPSEESLGGASWVDRNIISALTREFDVRVLALANRDGDRGHLRLEVRRHLPSALRTLRRMVLGSEPYFSAKFRTDLNWQTQTRAVRAALEQHSLLVTSQLPALLVAEEAGLFPDLHIAHNVDTVLAESHDPKLFRLLGNASRMEQLERRVLAQPRYLAALSTRDVARLKDWRLDASHWPLGVAGQIQLRKSGRIGFLGKGSWPPNIAAVEFLIDEVMPLVRPRLGSRTPQVVIAGRETSKWSGRPGVEVVGEVESAEEFYRSVDMVAVPRMGEATGVSVKMLEARACGVPVIVPPELARDAGLTDGYLSAKSTDETVDRIVEFYSGCAEAEDTYTPNAPYQEVPAEILRKLVESND